MGRVSPSTGRGFGTLWSARGAMEHLPKCHSALQGLVHRGQERGQAGHRRGTLPGQGQWHRGMKKLQGILVPGWRSSHRDAPLRLFAAMEDFFPHQSQRRNQFAHPTWLRQVLGRGAASKCSSPMPLDCVHRPSSLEKNPTPVLPILWQGLAMVSQATRPGKGHFSMPWGEAVPLVCLCLPAGTPHKPTLDSQDREGK